MAVNDLGTVKPGKTLYLYFDAFDSNDPSASTTISGLALADIKIFKDGGTTERASTSGFTLLDTDGIDFSGETGINGVSIDLSDDTTADFYKAGSHYQVVVGPVTIDAATINFSLASFEIGYEGAQLNTFITVTSQTQFTLDSGPAENDALNGCIVVIHDEASAVQMGYGVINDYTGASKTVDLIAALPNFTIATGDNISIFPPFLTATTRGTALDVTATGAAGIDWANIENPTTAVDLSGTDIQLVDTTTTNTDMRGTDNAALASVVGALADAAAAGDPTVSDTLMQYIKQLVNVLVGTTGVTTYPAEAAPANNVSLAEVLRAIHADVTGLNGDAMRGTDGANTTTPPTAVAIADQVWDEDIEAAHGTDATAGLLLRALGQEISNAAGDSTLLDHLKRVISVIEHQRGAHTHQPIGDIYYVDPTNGTDAASRGGISTPLATVQYAHDNYVTDSNHDMIILLSGAAAGATTLTEAVTLSKRYLFIRGPGRDFIWTRSGAGDTITITADGVELSGFQVNTAATGAGDGISVSGADFFRACRLWINDTQGDAIMLDNCDNFVIEHCVLQGSGVSGTGHGISVTAGTSETCDYGIISDNYLHNVAGDGIRFDPTGTGTINETKIQRNSIMNCTSDGIEIVGSGANDTLISDNRFGNNTSSDINDAGTNTVVLNNEQWAKHSIATEVRLAELDAANLPTDIATIDTAVNGIQTDLDNGTDGLGALLTAIQAISTTARGEPAQGAPGVSISALEKIDYLYKAWRNRVTQSTSQYTVYADDATTVDHKAPVTDDGTTFDKGEIATGP